MVSAFCSHHWFDTDGWVVKDMWPIQKPVPLLFVGYLAEAVEEDQRWNQLNQFHLIKSAVKQMWIW